MDTTWILVANASLAKLFSSHEKRLKGSKANLNLIKLLEHPESKVKDSEQVSDRHGRYFGHSDQQGDYSEETDPKAMEADKFARECADLLNEGRTSHEFQSLVLIASPSFYGLLGKHLNKHVSGMVLKAIQSDYTKISEQELIEHLNKSFELK